MITGSKLFYTGKTKVSRGKNPYQWNIPHSGRFLCISYIHGLDDNYGGGVGGVVRPCPLFFQDGEKYVPADSFRHMKQLPAYEQFIYILSR